MRTPIRVERARDPTSAVREYRAVVGFIYVLGIAFAAFFVGQVIAGIVRHESGRIAAGLFMCFSYAMFWSRVGRFLIRSTRRDRDKSLKRSATDAGNS